MARAHSDNRSFYEVLTEAVNDLVDNGYDSADRLEFWMKELRKAAERTMRSETDIQQMLNEGLRSIFARLVDKGGAMKQHPSVARFTIERLRPQLRAELDRRILASAQLIKLNRANAINQTLQRFAGWSTSIPKGGSDVVAKTKTKENIKKSMRSLPFEERRVLIDQGHKLTASINETIALGSGAIAGTWHSHWRQAGYNYRRDHKERDQQVYTIRGNWALEKGLMKAGKAGYYEDITAVAEEPFCRCYMTWIYHLRDLPKDMLTSKGQEELKRVRGEIKKMRAA